MRPPLALTFIVITVLAPGLQDPALSPRSEAETAAVAALLKLGVPLHQDSAGRVRWIEADRAELNDEALQHLSSLPLLEWLEIGGGKITAAGLTQLKGCIALRRLYIHDVSIGDIAPEWISHLSRLEALSLQHTGITGDGLKLLKGTKTLLALNLSDNGITDADLVQVARFETLEVLALQNTKVTGTGLARLEGMAKLNVLNLVNCRIVDADLDHFLSMPNLRIVHAEGCDISEKAVKETAVNLPMLSIFK